MRVLVTGSTGFVGRALMGALTEAGHEAAGFSRRAAPGSLQGDLLDIASLDQALADMKPELVYHLAAQTDLKGPAEKGYAANVEGVANLLDAVARAPSVCRVVWASSQLVYTPGKSPPSDEHFEPVGGYGESKAEGERLVRSRDGGGKEWVIFRSTTIWGPGMSDHYAGILRLIRRGRFAHIGRRPLRKSYSYIDNLAAQLVTLGTAPADRVHGRVFTLADSEPIELRAWHDGFAAEFGRTLPTVPTPVARLAALAGDLAVTAGVRAPITSTRLKNMLTEYLHDVRPIEAVHGRTVISNAEGVRRTAAWLRAEHGA